jgi:hypothetical protein
MGGILANIVTRAQVVVETEGVAAGDIAQGDHGKDVGGGAPLPVDIRMVVGCDHVWIVGVVEVRKRGRPRSW